jgi:hypothetical protein
MLDVIDRGDPNTAAWLVEELAVFRANTREQLRAKVEARDRPEVSDSWRRAWGARREGEGV